MRSGCCVSNNRRRIFLPAESTNSLLESIIRRGGPTSCCRRARLPILPGVLRSLLPAGQKEFRPRLKDSEAAAFEDFLRLIRDSIDHHESALLEAVSKGSDWARDLYESSMRIVARGFGDEGVTDRRSSQSRKGAARRCSRFNARCKTSAAGTSFRLRNLREFDGSAVRRSANVDAPALGRYRAHSRTSV